MNQEIKKLIDKKNKLEEETDKIKNKIDSLVDEDMEIEFAILKEKVKEFNEKYDYDFNELLEKKEKE